MKIAVCYMVMSARPMARKVAQALQVAQPTDEVILFDRIVAVAEPPCRELQEWGAVARVYVSTERRRSYDSPQT